MIHIYNPITGEETDIPEYAPIPEGWIRILVQVETSAKRPFNWFLLVLVLIALYWMYRRK